MIFDQHEWGTFLIGDLFDIGRPSPRNKDEYLPGDIPFVSSGSMNNGVLRCCTPRIDEIPDDGECITVSPVDGSSFYQPVAFLGRGGAGSSILILRRRGTSRHVMLFLTKAINHTCSKYTYGRMGNMDGIGREKILLPVGASGKPDWDFMEASVRERERELLERYLSYARQRLAECEFFMEGDFTLHVGDREWATFRIDELFEIRSGKRLETRNKEPGDMPFIGASELNNGVTGFVSNINSSLDSNTLGVNYNGAPCVAFYHPYQCLFSDDVKHLHIIGHEDNQHLMLFLAAVFAKQRVKFSYGYKCNEQRMRKQSIMLPVDSEGQPDWDFMERFSREREEAAVRLYRLHPGPRLDDGSELNLSERRWSPFQAFGDGGLFRIKATRSGIDGIRIIQGGDRTVPYVTRSDMNNGVAMFVSTENDMRLLDESGTISVGLDTQTAFYQPSQYLTGQNIHIVSGEHLTEGVAHFIVTLLRIQLRSKFNWGGNGATLGRMKRLKLMLPVDGEGRPDWDFMERYARCVMASKYRQYLDYIESAERDA